MVPTSPRAIWWTRCVIRITHPAHLVKGPQEFLRVLQGEILCMQMHVTCVCKESLKSLPFGSHGSCPVGCWNGACNMWDSHLSHRNHGAHQCSLVAVVSPKALICVLTGVLTLQAASDFHIKNAGQSLSALSHFPSPRLEKCRFSVLILKGRRCSHHVSLVQWCLLLACSVYVIFSDSP